MQTRVLLPLLACAALAFSPAVHASDPLPALTPEQQALLGCGPLWGTPCDRSGIDLVAAEAGVLMQSWVRFEGAYTAAYPQPGSVGFVRAEVLDPVTGRVFANEMTALSWNFLMLLVAHSSGGEGPDRLDPDDPYAHYDPSDPSTLPDRGQCSFAQPQYCSSIQSFFDVTGVRSGGNGSFGRRDYVWNGVGTSTRSRHGCLPERTGLGRLRASSPRGKSNKGRAGRCPAR